VLVAATISVVMMIALGHGMAHPLWALVFAVTGSAFLGGLGIVAAILAEKFDHMAAITNFLVVPLSFLSGTFYSIEAAARLDADGDASQPGLLPDRRDALRLHRRVRQLALARPRRLRRATAAVLGLCWHWFRTGYRLKA
jgi:ABC-2 type transport system permease protein